MPAPAVVAASRASDTLEAVREVVEALRPHDPSVVIAFVGLGHDPRVVATALAEGFPTARTLGCTSAGEIGPAGFTEGGLAAFALRRPARAAVEWFDDLATVPLDAVGQTVARLATQLGASPTRLSADRHLFVSLVDGVTSAGELLVAAVADTAPGVPLVGGSAGERIDRVEETWTFADGVAAPGSGVLALLEPGVPFRAFALHHFALGDDRLVVTRARPDVHLVDELNGWPAVREYARVAGVDEAALRSGAIQTGALDTHLGFRVGEGVALRAVIGIRGEALLVGGAVEDGMVLRAARPRAPLLEATRAGLAAARSDAGAASGALLFDCVGRRMLAARDGLLDALRETVSVLPVAGFHTFGEQYGPLQVNFTMTGAVFGGGDADA
jgi:hypothetical protein